MSPPDSPNSHDSADGRRDAIEPHDAQAAAEVYRELLGRVGEQAPQPRLDATRRVTELLGDPQHAYGIVHVTGTNGKTSTARMIESLLRASGLRTGLMTSPHLARVNERIAVDGEPIDDATLVSNWHDIRPFLLMADAELVANGQEPLTYFEALTVLAFAVFADAPVEVAVLEVGMGGEWDSTNVANADVAVFTPIALDHTHRLGATVAEIARTKSGIIKPASRVVTAAQEPDALAELRTAAELNEAPIAHDRVDFAVESSAVAVGGQLLDLRGRAASYPGLFLPLYGDHQAQNAAVAVAAAETFLGDGSRSLGLDVVAEGLAAVTSPGRLQLVGTEPTVLVDAAHNPHAARALAAALLEYFDFDEIGVVVGVLADKDAHGILAELAPIAARMFVTSSSSERAIDEGLLGHEAARTGVEFTVHDMVEAFDEARSWAAEAKRRAVVVTGSITLVADAIRIAETERWK